MLTYPDPAASSFPSGSAAARDGESSRFEPLAALADDALSGRFRAWRGASGRRYIFSVFDAANCPAYREAVLIAVAIPEDGRRRPIAFIDTGSFPEPLLSRLARSHAGAGGRLEFHLHLLAETAAERRVVLEDLGGAH